jgi:hypothetical protein
VNERKICLGVSQKRPTKTAQNNKKIKEVQQYKDNSIMVEQPKKSEFHCCCCGKKYTKQQGNFSASRSPFFVGNNGYLPACRLCVDDYYSQYVDIFGTDEAAI